MPAFSRRHYCPCWLVAVVVIAGAAPRQAAATTYRYSLIADELGSFSQLTVDSPRALNEAGQVAFYARENVGFDGHIFRHNGGSLTTIAAEPGFYDLTEYAPLALNDDGAVVFTGRPEFAHFGVFSGAGAGVSTVFNQNTTGDEPRRDVDGVNINDAGQVAYRGSRINFPDQPESVGQAGYYVIDGLTITTIAEIGSSYTHAGDQAPAFNEAGQLAFYMRPSATDYHLLRYTPGVGIATLATGFSSAQDPSINSHGDVAFLNNALSVQAHLDGAATTIADTAGGYQSFFQNGYGRAMINDSDQVAFFAALDGGAGGIFTGPDSVADCVVVDGQMLFGHEVDVQQLVGFNNRGQVLVMVDVGTSNTVRALILATPLQAADFQEDGDVDGDDLALWEFGFGLPGAVHATGDADGDEDADGADFLVWQREAGGGPLAVPTSDAVPEPATLVNLLAGFLLMFRRRRTKVL